MSGPGDDDDDGAVQLSRHGEDGDDDRALPDCLPSCLLRDHNVNCHGGLYDLLMARRPGKEEWGRGKDEGS